MNETASTEDDEPPLTHEVDPSRLASGRWDHASEKTLGEGDITGSYSGDRIGMGKPLRRPFIWHGSPWVCTGISNLSGSVTVSAYRLVAVEAFEGTYTTYTDKTRNAEAARNDPMGFYHGMTVQSAGRDWILSGPEHTFVAGVPEQQSLFAMPKDRNIRGR